MTNDDWQNYVGSLGGAPFLPPFPDPKNSQVYMNQMNAMGIADNDNYDRQYYNSIIEADNVDDSIKARVLYNELMKLKTELANTKRNLKSDINMLNLDHRRLIEENKRLSDEIAFIKQSLYFD